MYVTRNRVGDAITPSGLPFGRPGPFYWFMNVTHDAGLVTPVRGRR